MKHARPITALIAIVLVSLIATTALATEGVSPGAVDRVAQVNDPCPTFSWGMDSDTVAYDLVAYVLPEDASQQVELIADTEVLFTRVAGSATSWTPSAEQCFAPGGRYVWYVRAVSELAGDDVVAAGEWSAGRYFTVPVAPSAEEMQRAIEVLRRWEAANGDGSPTPFAVAVPAAASGTGSGTGSGSDHRKSVPTASAAIRGENPAVSGEAYGVVGMSSSYNGAGVAAANDNGGPDLVLDGSVDGEPDARLWEWGLDRASATDWSFRFSNSGAGDMTLEVDGTLKATELDCPSCVTTAHIANQTITTVDLADDAVSEVKLEDEAVSSGKIVTGAVTGAKIANNAVTTAKIADGTIAAADLADGAVTSTKIASGAVSSSAIHSNAVTSSHIVDGTIVAADISPAAALDADTLDGQDGSYYQPKVIIVKSGPDGTVHAVPATCAPLRSTSVETGGSGTVVVTGEAAFALEASSLMKQPWLAVAAAAGVCDDRVRWYGFGSSDLQIERLTVTRVFTIPSAGTYTYFLNSKMHLGYVPDTDTIQDESLVAVFYPD
jgi:hypothetical protein